MDKALYRQLQARWTRVDRLTAYGCAMRRTPYDPAAFSAAVADYNALVLRTYGFVFDELDVHQTR